MEVLCCSKIMIHVQQIYDRCKTMVNWVLPVLHECACGTCTCVYVGPVVVGGGGGVGTPSIREVGRNVLMFVLRLPQNVASSCPGSHGVRGLRAAVDTLPSKPFSLFKILTRATYATDMRVGFFLMFYSNKFIATKFNSK